MVLMLLLIMPFCVKAQVLVKGTVMHKNIPVAGANVMFSNKEGKMAAGTVTRTDGSFDVKIMQGTYTVAISFMGFTGWEQSLALQQDTVLDTIQLQQNTTNLETFVVTGRKKAIEYKTDRMVLNMENNIVATGGNALNAISTAPGIMVQNNDIAMLGKGTARIMVDGRFIDLAGEDLVSFLKSISAADIKSIEIIANPPAQYDAAGGGGIINIILKKGLKNSWKNTLTAASDHNHYNFYTLRNSFLYNKNRIRLAAGAGGKLGYSRVQQDLTTLYPKGPWMLTYTGKQKENNLSARAALDYDLSAKTTIGFQYLAMTNDPGSRDLVKVSINNAASVPDSLLINNGNRNLGNSNHSFNAHIVSAIDSAGKRLSADVDLFRYHSSVDNSFVANVYTPDMQFLRTNQSARNISAQQITSGSMKLDMEHPTKLLRLEYGIKAAYTKSNSNIAFYNTISGTPVPDVDQFNTFDYRETNGAAYISGAKSLGKWNVRAGMRMEYTHTKGYAAAMNSTTVNDYLQFFPSLYLSYKHNNQHQYLLGYGRKINRPGFALLNPFRSYINSTSYSEGNPFLQPSFNDNFDFTYVHKGAWRTNLFFNITHNGFGPVFTSDPQTNVLVITRRNYFREYYYGIGEVYTASITPWWQGQYSVYLMDARSRFNAGINARPANNMQFYLSAGNTFSFSSSSGLQIDYMYSSPFKRGLYEIGYRSGLNIAFRQGFLKNNLQLSLLCNDVFNTAYLKDYTSVVNGIKQVYSENNSSRFLRLTLTWNIGNDKLKVQQRNFGNEEERARVN